MECNCSIPPLASSSGLCKLVPTPGMWPSARGHNMSPDHRNLPESATGYRPLQTLEAYVMRDSPHSSRFRRSCGKVEKVIASQSNQFRAQISSYLDAGGEDLPADGGRTELVVRARRELPARGPSELLCCLRAVFVIATADRINPRNLCRMRRLRRETVERSVLTVMQVTGWPSWPGTAWSILSRPAGLDGPACGSPPGSRTNAGRLTSPLGRWRTGTAPRSRAGRRTAR